MPPGSASWSHTLTCLHAPQLRRWERSLPRGWEGQSWDSTAFPSQLPRSLLALFSISSLSICVLQEFPSPSVQVKSSFPGFPISIVSSEPIHTHTSLHRPQSWHGRLFSCPCFHRTPQGLSVTLSRSSPLPSFQRWWTSRQRSLSASCYHRAPSAAWHLSYKAHLNPAHSLLNSAEHFCILYPGLFIPQDDLNCCICTSRMSSPESDI